jgi:predicted transcriptional regulator
MEEQPIIRTSITRTVVVGPELRNRLEAVARTQGADASYLARTVLRRYLDAHEHAARAEEHE